MNLAICLAKAAAAGVPKTAETAASRVNNLFSNLMLHISPANKAKNTRHATNSLLGSAIPWMVYSIRVIFSVDTQDWKRKKKQAIILESGIQHFKRDSNPIVY